MWFHQFWMWSPNFNQPDPETVWFPSSIVCCLLSQRILNHPDLKWYLKKKLERFFINSSNSTYVEFLVNPTTEWKPTTILLKIRFKVFVKPLLKNFFLLRANFPPFFLDSKLYIQWSLLRLTCRKIDFFKFLDFGFNTGTSLSGCNVSLAFCSL